MNKIYPSRYYFSKSDIDFILKNFKTVLENREFLTMGKWCSEFEKQFARYIGVKHAISVNNGTSALEMIFSALDLAGKEVIVTTNTFAATAFAIIKAGAIPVFADILPDLTINPKDVLKKITPKTKAIVTVHIGGMVSLATEELLAICRQKNLYFVEDAAHAHGSALNGKMAGSFGVAGAFSFYSTKVMATGEGGMITTNDEILAKKLMVLRDQGKEDSKSLFPNFHRVLGYNFRLTELQAIMGISQLKRLDSFIKKRQELAKVFEQELAGAKNLSVLKVPSSIRHNYYKYIVFLAKQIPQKEFILKMKQETGIPLSGCAYEMACHEQPVFKKYVKGSFPIADDLCHRHIAMPIYFEMTKQQAKQAAKAVRSLAEKY